MSTKLRFFKGAYDYFFQMDITSLEKEIEKSNKFLIGKTVFKNLREQRNHDGLQKRHEVLMLILKLRNKEISTEEFEVQVKFFN